MARTKQTLERTHLRHKPCTRRENSPYSDRQIESARLGYAIWAGITIDSVSGFFVQQSSYGVDGWANILRKEMLQSIIEVRNGYSKTFLDLLPEELIRYMVRL